MVKSTSTRRIWVKLAPVWLFALVWGCSAEQDPTTQAPGTSLPSDTPTATALAAAAPSASSQPTPDDPADKQSEVAPPPAAAPPPQAQPPQASVAAAPVVEFPKALPVSDVADMLSEVGLKPTYYSLTAGEITGGASPDAAMTLEAALAQLRDNFNASHGVEPRVAAIVAPGMSDQQRARAVQLAEQKAARLPD